MAYKHSETTESLRRKLDAIMEAIHKECGSGRE